MDWQLDIIARLFWVSGKFLSIFIGFARRMTYDIGCMMYDVAEAGSDSSPFKRK
jgi:hypothetical protein